MDPKPTQIKSYLSSRNYSRVNQKEKSKINQNDTAFDNALKKSVQGHSYIHWTPIEVIQTAVEWLGTKSENRILDIGSGVGKFCIIGAMNSRAHFTGVETRKNLVDEAIVLKKELKLSNVDFIHSDIKEIDFKNFTSFYFYNPFCEHMAISGSIDDQIKFDEEAYYFYQDFVVDQLKKTPKGTKLVMYCSPDLDISIDFDLKDMYFEGLLQLWVKR
ncbi:MAG: SAM-dependent methyltransferase [Fluviicola sp.]|nr:MAG: SAM-dependent methyltransferase [Fluviicola sp.]